MRARDRLGTNGVQPRRLSGSRSLANRFAPVRTSATYPPTTLHTVHSIVAGTMLSEVRRDDEGQDR